MKEEPGLIYTEPKIPVTTPVRFCSDCKYYLQTAAQYPCEQCLRNTKAEKWEPK